MKKLKSIVLACLLAFSFAFITPVFSGCSCNGSNLKLDSEQGKIASERVENAQYSPDIDKYLAAQNTEQNLSFDGIGNFIAENQAAFADASEIDEATSGDEFIDLVNQYTKVENYAGAGKPGGYDIYEIKNEIKFVVDNVPAFNQWFRMPPMREEEGYISIQYYEGWAYYLEQKDGVLSITRVCWATRSRYIDFANKKVVEYYDTTNRKSFSQYEIMKINYYKESDKEVVESSFYSVGIDNVLRSEKYNSDENDYYPFEYQYLKNVEDTYLVKYHITVAQRYSADEVSGIDFGDDGSAMDIRGQTPYGIRREITVVNYAGYKNIEVTQIDQKFATINHPEYDGAVSFDVNSNNIKLLKDTIGLKDVATNITAKDFMDKAAKQIIDNFELKNNWKTIYKKSANAEQADMIEGPFYKKDAPIWVLRVSVDCCGHNNDELRFDANSYVADQNFFTLGHEYSYSVALRERTSGKLYIIGTNYQIINNITENGLQFVCDVNASSIKVDTDGVYDLTCVITEKVNGEDKIVFDTLETAFLIRYFGLEIPDSTDAKGVTHSYKCAGYGGKLVITVTTKA